MMGWNAGVVRDYSICLHYRDIFNLIEDKNGSRQ
jgi:hypothetical protein